MELSFISGLYGDGVEPWASVYLDVTHTTQEAIQAVRIRWKDLRANLLDQGLDAGTVRALETELIDERTLRVLDGAPFEESPHPGRHGAALFASRGEVQYSDKLGEPPQNDSAEVSPLPHLTPLLVQRGEQVPWLRVIVNRVGADLQDPAHDVTLSVEGSNLIPIRKTHGGGGWSQENLQRKAELRWHNSKEVAEQVGHVAETFGVELVVIAGDVRARQSLIEQLPNRWRARTVEVDGGSRARGSDPGVIDKATQQAVDEVARRRKADAIDRFMVGGGENVVEGAPAVAAAFDRSQVGTLLMDPDTVAKVRLWAALDLPHLAASEDELRALGAQQLHQVRAEDGLVRAAAMTGADFVLVSADDVRLDDGVGAVLRYVDPSTPRR